MRLTSILLLTLSLSPLSASDYGWRYGDKPDVFNLYQNGVHRGVYDAKTAQFRYVYNGIVTPEPCAPPCWISNEMKTLTEKYAKERRPADMVKTVEGDSVPTGVQWDKIDPEPTDEHFHSTGGKRITRDEALQRIRSANGIPDFSKSLHLTPIGPKDFRDRVKEDFDKSTLKNACVFHDIDPADPRENWQLEPGFVKDGTQLYLQNAEREVLARLTEYAGPEALRKIDPNYKPEKDPDPTKPKPKPTPTPLNPDSVPPPLAAIVTAALAFLGTKREDVK